ncbi:MAG: ABC transporter ATP-binding protein [Paludibacteraceae bacterium]|nr:ABC transporter ATP-binding protein [Paludibacteraceae bacterium]MBP5481603.1 ABC transporter ATP-binding protein [Paludibacteraceae bacterium]
MIIANNITKSFGQFTALRGVNLSIEKGEFVSIIGASGAGKTTLLQILGTLDKPDMGEVTINGTNVFSLSDDEQAAFRNKHIGFVFQFHQLLPEFTALENIMIPALIAKREKSEAEREAKELLAFMNLSERADHKPSELSGGEKQRVAVARALINKPDVLLADEPTGSLDSKNKQDIHRLFCQLQKEMGQTLVVVTHDMEMASGSGRIINMQDGRIIEN